MVGAVQSKGAYQGTPDPLSKRMLGPFDSSEIPNTHL
jgi:hypothetical protein